MSRIYIDLTRIQHTVYCTSGETKNSCHRSILLVYSMTVTSCKFGLGPGLKVGQTRHLESPGITMPVHKPRFPFVNGHAQDMRASFAWESLEHCLVPPHSRLAITNTCYLRPKRHCKQVTPVLVKLSQPKSVLRFENKEK